jgi:hypothetical protein
MACHVSASSVMADAGQRVLRVTPVCESHLAASWHLSAATAIQPELQICASNLWACALAILCLPMKLSSHVSGSSLLVDSILTTTASSCNLTCLGLVSPNCCACCLLRVQDNEVMEQIDRDVMRTHPDMHFFSGEDRRLELHSSCPCCCCCYCCCLHTPRYAFLLDAARTVRGHPPLRLAK